MEINDVLQRTGLTTMKTYTSSSIAYQSATDVTVFELKNIPKLMKIVSYKITNTGAPGVTGSKFRVLSKTNEGASYTKVAPFTAYQDITSGKEFELITPIEIPKGQYLKMELNCTTANSNTAVVELYYVEID